MLRNLLETVFSPAVVPAAPVSQAGALPYALVGGRPVFLLVTSRRSGRWIFPKGALVEGLEPWQAAAREAFEEAGVEGEIERVPVGSYRTRKRDLMGTVIDVALYPMRVEHQHDDWPERHQRFRHWAILSETRRLVSDRRLAELARLVSRRVSG